MSDFRAFFEAGPTPEDVLVRIRSSPQWAKAAPDYDWGRYQSRWGLTGGFTSGRVEVETLVRLVDNHHCKLSTVSDDAVATKVQQRAYNAVVLTCPPNEPWPLAILDGSHSLVAAWRNRVPLIDVIASQEAVRYLGDQFKPG